MGSVPFDDDDIIIRRIPPGEPGFDTVIKKPDGELRPTSATLGLASDELGLSCSLKKITSAKALLGLIKDSNGWRVAEWRISDLPSNLEVVHVRTDEDPGHCEIRPKAGEKYTKKQASQLAKKARVLDELEIDPESANP